MALLDKAKKFLFTEKKQAGFVRTSNSFSNELDADMGGVGLAHLRISTDSLFTIWRNNADVFACVREISQNTGADGFYWENATSSDKDPNTKSIAFVEQLFKSNTTFRRLKEKLLTNEGVSGNAFVLIQKNEAGKIIGLESLDPRTMHVITDKYGTILRWVQRVKSETQEFQPDEIAHLTTYQDPNSPVFGFSPLEPVIWEVRTDLAAMVSNYAFFQNDAQPAAQIILEDGISDDEVKSAVELLQRQVKGAENRHKTVVLKGVKEIKTIAISQKDMEFMNQRKFTTEKVCAAYGVPKAILNYTEDVNLANGQEQTKKFWEGTIHPKQEMLQEFINKILLPMIGVLDIKLVFNERKFDNIEWNEASTRADVQLGILTINEAREARGYEPYDATISEFVDKPILYGGLGAKPLEDLGVDFSTDVPAVMDEAAQQKRLMVVEPRKYAKSSQKS